MVASVIVVVDVDVVGDAAVIGFAVANVAMLPPHVSNHGTHCNGED